MVARPQAIAIDCMAIIVLLYFLFFMGVPVLVYKAVRFLTKSFHKTNKILTKAQMARTRLSKPHAPATPKLPKGILLRGRVAP